MKKRTKIITGYLIPLIVILIFANSTYYGKTRNKMQKKDITGISATKKIKKERITAEKPVYGKSKNYLLGKISPSADTLFIKVDKEYIGYNKVIYLRKPVYTAYRKMYAAALKNNIKLNLISGFRSFNHQKRIWENKWTGKTKVEGKNLAITISNPVERAKTILKFSSMPGTSRHHWGTDIDIYSLNDNDFKTKKGREVYNWLITNAESFGFCQTYTPKDSTRPTGYEEEKWHWSYFPISEFLLKEYQNKIKYSDISGFKGSETSASLKVIENYVVSVNQECK